MGLIILRKLEDNNNNNKSIEQFSGGSPTTSAGVISEMELEVPGGKSNYSMLKTYLKNFMKFQVQI